MKLGWIKRTLGECCEMYQPKTITSKDMVDAGLYPVYGANGVIGRYDKFNHEAPQLLITCRGATCGTVNVSQPYSWITGNAMVVRPKEASLDFKFLEFVFRGGLDIQKAITGAAQPQITRANLEQLEIFYPISLDEQRSIVDILCRADGIVRLRREAEKKTAELIPALFLDMFGDPTTNPKGWTLALLGEHVKIASSVKTPDLNQEADLPCIGADSIESHTGKLIGLPTVRDVLPISGKYQFKSGDVLYSKIRPYLAKASLAPCNGYCSADMYPLSCKPSLRADFLLALLLSKSFTDYATAESVRAQMPKLNRQTLFAYQFPVPSTELQEQFSDRASAVYSIQSQQSAATAKAQAAFDALLAQAFQSGV